MNRMFGDVARALGRVSRAALIAGFAISGGAALALLSVAANTHHDVLVRVGGVIAVVLSVMLLIVVTWYRRERGDCSGVGLDVRAAGRAHFRDVGALEIVRRRRLPHVWRVARPSAGDARGAGRGRCACGG